MKYKAWTDGSSIQNKYAGWCVLLEKTNSWEFVAGEDMDLTHNAAELEAVRQALLLDLEDCTEIEIVTDSIYVINMLERGFNARKNVELVDHIRELMQDRDVVFTKTKGHDKDDNNKTADKVAYQRAKALQNRVEANLFSFIIESFEDDRGKGYTAHLEGYDHKEYGDTKFAAIEAVCQYLNTTSGPWHKYV